MITVWQKDDIWSTLAIPGGVPLEVVQNVNIGCFRVEVAISGKTAGSGGLSLLFRQNCLGCQERPETAKCPILAIPGTLGSWDPGNISGSQATSVDPSHQSTLTTSLADPDDQLYRP